MTARQQNGDNWLVQAHQTPSDNYNQRPSDANINLLVIHNISLPAGEFGGPFIEQLFTNCLDCNCHPSFDDLRGVCVSSHLLIDRHGKLSQFVPLNQRAWHAGESEYQGAVNCNDFSIGIELEGDDNTPYTEAQYQALSAISKQLMSEYPAITAERIVGHCDIAPQRKTDPGPAFDWNYFRRLLDA